MTQTTLEGQISRIEQRLYMGMELSQNQWKLSFGSGGKPRIKQIAARDLAGLALEISKAKKKFNLSDDAPVVSCYEAGRDGFWIHRWLLSIGVQNIVVDSSSIEVSRRKRRAKTDRIDAIKLYKMLLRHFGGEQHVWSVVRVPSREDEDERRTHRELERLQKERIAHNNRIKSLLVTQGIVVDVNRNFPELLERIRLWDGSSLSHQLISELRREFSRMREIDKQILEMRKEQRRQIKEDKEDKKLQLVNSLISLRGIGAKSAWRLVYEFLWRDFENRRQVGSAAGLCGTPYDSGGSNREQGISKAGNKRIRLLMVELSWFWLRYQPNSVITLWFNERFAAAGKRMRRIGIVAVARRLLIGLWKFAKFGEVPDGALFKKETTVRV